jgi:chromosome segregation ATPase
MVKKGLLGAALGAGTLFLVFGTSAPNYIKTAFCRVRQTAKDSIFSSDPRFEIERVRNEIAGLQPMFDENKEKLARAIVEAQILEKEIVVHQANLEKEKGALLSLRDKVKNGDFRLTGHNSLYTADEIKGQLAVRKDRYDYGTGILKQKQEVLKAKHNTIDAARNQLDSIKEQRSLLLARLAQVEARLQMIETTNSKNEFHFDNSALARAKQAVSELEQRLDVMAQMAEIEARYGELDGAAPSYVDPARDVVKEIDEAFGPPSAPKPGDKSL